MVVLSLLASASCAPDSTGVAADGGGEPADGLVIEVGTGAPGSFARVEEGEVLRLQRGCQGAQHVFTSVRVRGAEATHAIVRLEIVRASDQAVVTAPFEVRLAYEDDPDEGVRRITGMTPVVEDPQQVVGEAAEIRVTVREAGRDGAAEGEVRGVVQWGADVCAPHG